MPAAPEGGLLAHDGDGRPWVARDFHGHHPSFPGALPSLDRLLDDPSWQKRML